MGAPSPGSSPARSVTPRRLTRPSRATSTCNISFVAIEGSRVRARIFERGVGETLSSGTGASGAAVTAFLRGSASPLVVELEGGELQVEISEDLAVRLDGWAEPVFAGELSPELLQALAQLDGD